MTVYKNNRDKWCVDVEFAHPDGRVQRVRKTSPKQTKRDAEKYERELRDSLAAGTFGKKRAAERKVPTVSEFMGDLLEVYRGEKHKAAGVYNRRCIFNRHLVPMFGDREVTSFNVTDQRKLRGRFTDYKSNSRYNQAVSVMNRLIELYHTENRLPGERFRFEQMKSAQAIKAFYDFAQLDALVKGAAEVGPVAECAVLLGSDAGARRGEIFALEPRHCDLNRRLLNIEASETLVGSKRSLSVTKGGDGRVVPMTKRLHAALARRIGAMKRGETRIIVNWDGGPFWDKSFAALMNEIQEAADMEPTGAWHILRHTFCSHLAILGVPVMTIKELAGHKSLRTTLMYMHLASGETRRAIDALEGLPQAAE